MLQLKTWTWALALWCAISYVLCVVWGFAFPSQLHSDLMAVGLPAFGWTATGFFIGLVESLVYGAYGGALFAGLHNLLYKRQETSHAS